MNPQQMNQPMNPPGMLNQMSPAPPINPMNMPMQMPMPMPMPMPMSMPINPIMNGSAGAFPFNPQQQQHYVQQQPANPNAPMFFPAPVVNQDIQPGDNPYNVLDKRDRPYASVSYSK